MGRRDAQGGWQLPGLRRADPRARRALAGPDQGRSRPRECRPRAADADKAERIAAAGDAIARGEHDDQFPIDVFQTGSETSSNMNANEAIAALAGEDVHANDDVNMGQSSNDIFPSAVHLAALGELEHDLLPALDGLATALERRRTSSTTSSSRGGRISWTPSRSRSGRNSPVMPTGAARDRTDRGQPQAARPDPARRHSCRHRPEHAPRLRREGARPAHRRNRPPDLSPADPFEAQAARDGLVEASAALKVVAVSLTKIANDLRLMGSGPRAGLAEIFLPELQKGSSIMPGKVNPVIPEVVTQVAAQVIGTTRRSPSAACRATSSSTSSCR